MKTLLFLLSVLSWTICFSQHKKPPVIELLKSNSSDNTIFSEDYEILTYNFRDSIKSFNKITTFEKDNLKLPLLEENKVQYLIYHDEMDLLIPKKGSIISIRIEDKKNENQYMTILIRLSYNMNFGDILSLNNLEFIEGNYFYDMCLQNSQFSISESNLIDLSNVRNHKINNKKLRKLMKRNKCN